jgi:hypothetical protein
VVIKFKLIVRVAGFDDASAPAQNSATCGRRVWFRGLTGHGSPLAMSSFWSWLSRWIKHPLACSILSGVNIVVDEFFLVW